MSGPRPLDAQRHLQAELARLLEHLSRHLERQRNRGRSIAGDAVRGVVIEDGEAEGLIADLRQGLDRPLAGGAARLSRGEMAARADTGGPESAALPLRRAARAFELSDLEYDALILALAVEVDQRFGRLVAYLNDHAGRPRPTLGLAMALRGDAAVHASALAEFSRRPVIRDGLLELDGDGPLPGLGLRLPPSMLSRLTGNLERETRSIVAVDPPELGRLEQLILESAVRERLAVWIAEQRGGRGPAPLILHGVQGSGRSSIGRAAILETGLALVSAELTPETAADRLRLIRAEGRWHDAAVMLRVGDGAAAAFDWRKMWRDIQDLDRPLALVVPSASVEAAAAAAPREPAILHVAEPGPAMRSRLWKALLPRGEPIDDAALTALGGRFRFNPGAIHRAIRRALAEQSLAPAGKRRLDLTALDRACRAVGAAAMGPLAQKLPLPYQRADLVVPPHVETELDLAMGWITQQQRVLEEWGFARRIPMGRGLTALFSGPPGTGKTMAAQVLARELGLELYRVDLSRVMSKYIGETEKNLAQLFDQAQAASAVLFFDEADALFGKRSEVKDAHDRYANVEIGYLLQRMEEFEGVTVLATNRSTDMDEAFVRRFHVIVDFPLPSEADRLRIWMGMFPAAAAREPDLDLAALARDFQISGGEIRNSVLAAAYLAAAEHKPIGMRHLQRALKRELIKSGKVVDERKFGARP